MADIRDQLPTINLPIFGRPQKAAEEQPQTPTLPSLFDGLTKGAEKTTGLPNLGDLTKGLTQPQSLLGIATETYCAASHPGLYAKSFALGGGVALASVLIVVGMVAIVGRLARTLRGQ